MREEIHGQVFDTYGSMHLGMFCASCDYDGEVEHYLAGLLLKLNQMEAKVEELQGYAVKKDTGQDDNQRDDEETLDNMDSWSLCDEADQSCSFIKGVFDVLDVSSGKDLFEGTVSALAFKSELEVERLERIIGILRTRTRALEKAAW